VFEGIKMEARQQLKETSGIPEGSNMLEEAMDNICETWQTISDLVTDFDKDAPLTGKIFRNPDQPITQLMLTIYSLECFLYKSLNAALRFGDESKIDSLGPYAQVMY
jgi:hypothetical protein